MPGGSGFNSRCRKLVRRFSSDVAIDMVIIIIIRSYLTSLGKPPRWEALLLVTYIFTTGTFKFGNFDLLFHFFNNVQKGKPCLLLSRMKTFLLVAGSGDRTHYLPAQRFIMVKVSRALTTRLPLVGSRVVYSYTSLTKMTVSF